MASTSNSFDALQNANFVTISKKKRRNKKSTVQPTESEVLDPTNSSELRPRIIPTSKDLETAATAATTEKTRLELWTQWTNEVRDEESLRRGTYIDSEGKPIFFRKALVTSRAFECLAESCLSSPVDEEQGNCLYHLFTSVFTSVEADILQQFVYALVKASNLSQKESTEVILASKKALSEVIAAIKKADVVAAEGFNAQWKKRNSAKQERQSTEKRAMQYDKKKELSDALDALKTQQQSIDDVGDESMEGLGGAAAIRSISDLRFAFSINRQSFDQTNTPTSKKGKKNKSKNANSAIETLLQEDANLALQENRLIDEISELEGQIQRLRSQLSTVQSSRQLIKQKKEAQQTNLQPQPPDHPIQISDDQKELITGLEGVISEIQSAAGLSADQKSARARGYVEAMEKLFLICSGRQDEIHKSMTFLRESLTRRLKQEETMREISSAAVTKDLIKSQKNSRLELESQIKEQLFESGDLIIKLDRVISDLKFRANFVEKHTSRTTLTKLEDSALTLKQRHVEIKAESEIRREPVATPKEQENSNPKRRIDVQKLVEEEGLKVRRELAAKLEVEQRTSHQTSHQVVTDEVRNSVNSSPSNGGSVNHSPPQPTLSNDQDQGSGGWTQPKRKAWKTVGSTAQVDSDFPALPSAGDKK